ncbi:hypothetical protein C8J57DRAFT_1077543, partial [Mycena rebaudengoi]
RFYGILISESVYLIWKLGNERVIRNKNEPSSAAEIQNRWIDTINSRLKLDCRMTNKKY